MAVAPQPAMQMRLDLPNLKRSEPCHAARESRRAGQRRSWAKQATEDMAGSERRALVRAWLSGENCVPIAGARDGGHGLQGWEAYHPPENKLDESRHGDLGYSWDGRKVA